MLWLSSGFFITDELCKVPCRSHLSHGADGINSQSDVFLSQNFTASWACLCFHASSFSLQAVVYMSATFTKCEPLQGRNPDLLIFFPSRFLFYVITVIRYSIILFIFTASEFLLSRIIQRNSCTVKTFFSASIVRTVWVSLHKETQAYTACDKDSKYNQKWRNKSFHKLCWSDQAAF